MYVLAANEAEEAEEAEFRDGVAVDAAACAAAVVTGTPEGGGDDDWGAARAKAMNGRKVSGKCMFACCCDSVTKSVVRQWKWLETD
jgi:hypothetical protein